MPSPAYLHSSLQTFNSRHYQAIDVKKAGDAASSKLDETAAMLSQSSFLQLVRKRRETILLFYQKRLPSKSPFKKLPLYDPTLHQAFLNQLFGLSKEGSNEAAVAILQSLGIIRSRINNLLTRVNDPSYIKTTEPVKDLNKNILVSISNTRYKSNIDKIRNDLTDIKTIWDSIPPKQQERMRNSTGNMSQAISYFEKLFTIFTQNTIYIEDLEAFSNPNTFNTTIFNTGSGFFAEELARIIIENSAADIMQAGFEVLRTDLLTNLEAKELRLTSTNKLSSVDILIKDNGISNAALSKSLKALDKSEQFLSPPGIAIQVKSGTSAQLGRRQNYDFGEIVGEAGRQNDILINTLYNIMFLKSMVVAHAIENGQRQLQIQTGKSDKEIDSIVSQFILPLAMRDFLTYLSNVAVIDIILFNGKYIWYIDYLEQVVMPDITNKTTLSYYVSDVLPLINQTPAATFTELNKEFYQSKIRLTRESESPSYVQDPDTWVSRYQEDPDLSSIHDTITNTINKIQIANKLAMFRRNPTRSKK